MTSFGVSSAITHPIAIIAIGLTFAGCGGREPTDFDADTWRQGETLAGSTDDAPRLRMAEGLIKGTALLGKSKLQIEALLGPPTSTSKFSDYGLVYWLGPERGFMSIDSEWLVITFDSDGISTDAEIVRD
jgi:hypothetical protein